MKYTSETIQKILKSPLAVRGLDYISPIYSEAKTALWLMEAIGQEYDTLIEWIEQYKLQVTPETATWGIRYYEEEYNLPINDERPLRERIDAVKTTIRSRAPMNPLKMANLISLNIGFPVKIIENTAKNTFTICLLDAGEGGYYAKAKRVADRIKPAHLIYDLFVKLDPVIFQNECHADLKRIVFSMRTENLGIEKILLDGKKQLNGTWMLQLIFQKGVSMHHVNFYMKQKESLKSGLFRQSYHCFIKDKAYQASFEKLSFGTKKENKVGSMDLKSAQLLLSIFNPHEFGKRYAISYGCYLQNKEGAKQEKVRFLNREKNEQGAKVPLVVQNVKIKNKNTAHCSVITDTLYYLDGNLSLNGKRKLNADNIRSEL